VTRPRSRAPGSPDPVYRRSRLPLLLLVAFAVSACLGSGTPAASTAQGTATAAVGPSTAAGASASPVPSASAAPATAPPSLTPEPTASPTDETGASASPGAEGSVDGCTGTDDNRAFFAKAARDLDWPVYCAALPARWFVSTGSYSRASGGKLEISYKGPNGARFELHEGAFCAASDGCVPAATGSGYGTFGDQAATIVELEDGRVAAVVDRGERISWLALGDGLGADDFATITSVLIRLD
jgi:hypothetical protein